MQTTLIIIKPDAVHRQLVGEIISRLEHKGMRIVACKFQRVSEDLARRHYAEHEGKPFFDYLIRFITSTPVMVMAIRGREAVSVCRALIGSTDGAAADPGTIRGDYGLSKTLNMIHGSDSPASSEREVALWFRPEDIHEWSPALQPWIV